MKNIVAVFFGADINLQKVTTLLKLDPYCFRLTRLLEGAKLFWRYFFSSLFILFYFFILTGLSVGLVYALFIATLESFITAKKSLDFPIRIVDKRRLYQHACQLNRWQCCVTHILTSRPIFTSRLDFQMTNRKICPNLAPSQVSASL